MSEPAFKHPLQNSDYYTPITPEIVAMLIELRQIVRTLRRLEILLKTKRRHLRRILKGETKAISMSLLDRIHTEIGTPYQVNDYLWFTAEDLVSLGIWQPTGYVAGDKQLVVRRYDRPEVEVVKTIETVVTRRVKRRKRPS